METTAVSCGQYQSERWTLSPSSGKQKMAHHVASYTSGLCSQHDTHNALVSSRAQARLVPY